MKTISPSPTIKSKYIIPKEKIKILNEIFYPFKDISINKNILNSDFIQKSQKLLHTQNQLKENIQQLRNEIDFLNSTKKNIESKIQEWEEKKNQFQEEKDKLKAEAEKDAQKIITESQKKAEEIIANTQKEKESIETEAQKNKQQIITESQEIGYKDGFEKGYQKGEQEREEIESYLRKILNESIRKKDEIVESIRQHLVDLVFTAVQKVVKKITEKDKKVVLKNIVEALRKIDDPVKVTIKVSYDDLKASTTFKSQLLASLKNLKQVEIMADPSIESGGCIVETDFTIVDSRISTQLDKIGMALNSLDLVKSQKL